MDKDIHNEDEQYRQAYERLEEEPSPQVLDKIMAKLDGRDARYYHSKFINWKRTSLLLLVLLGTVTVCSVLYQLNKNPATVIVAKSNGKEKKFPASAPGNGLMQTDSNPIIQNKNQKEPYATSKQQQTNAGTGNATDQTSKEHIGAAREQVNTRSGKQYTEQVQNNSLESLSSNIKSEYKKKSNAEVNQAERKAVKQYPMQFTGRTAQSKENKVLVETQQKDALKKSRAITFLPVPGKENTSLNNSAARLVISGGSNNKSIEKPPAETLDINTKNAVVKEKIDPNTINNTNQISVPAFANDINNSNTISTAKNKKSIRPGKSFKPYLLLTPYASLDMAQYHLDNDGHENNGARHEDKHEIEERERHGFSFSAGLLATLQASKKLSFKTGLVYSNTAININPQTLYAVADNNSNIAYKLVTSSGYAYINQANGITPAAGDSLKVSHSQHQLQFLSVPLMIGYKVYAGKHLTIVPSAGAAANILLSTEVKTEINEPGARESIFITKLNGLQSWYPSYAADAEIRYNINNRFNITLLPSFRYAIIPVTKNSTVKTYPYTLGLGLGFTYRF